MNFLKSYRLWVILSAIFQLLTGLIHGSTHFVAPQAKNDTEKQLLDLFQNYKQDLGAGYVRSMDDLFTGVSAGFTLLYVLGGLINWYLLRKNVSTDVMSGILNIQVVVYGVSFVLMLFFTFLPPIVLTGLVFVFLLTSIVAMRVEKK